MVHRSPVAPAVRAHRPTVVVLPMRMTHPVVLSPQRMQQARNQIPLVIPNQQQQHQHHTHHHLHRLLIQLTAFDWNAEKYWAMHCALLVTVRQCNVWTVLTVLRLWCLQFWATQFLNVILIWRKIWLSPISFVVRFYYCLNGFHQPKISTVLYGDLQLLYWSWSHVAFCILLWDDLM